MVKCHAANITGHAKKEIKNLLDDSTIKMSCIIITLAFYYHYKTLQCWMQHAVAAHYC